MNLTPILLNINKHIELNEEEIQFFSSMLSYRKINKKEFLLQQGDVCKTENFIVKGCLKTYSLDSNGNEHILMFGIEDWWVGDLYSFLTQTPSNYFVEALEDSEFIQISKDNLDELYVEVPKFERFFRLILQNAFIAQQQRIEQNLAYTAEERYLDFQKKYPTLEQRISQKQIASFLGITPVFLSMLRKKLVQK